MSEFIDSRTRVWAAVAAGTAWIQSDHPARWNVRNALPGHLAVVLLGLYPQRVNPGTWMHHRLVVYYVSGRSTVLSVGCRGKPGPVSLISEASGTRIAI